MAWCPICRAEYEDEDMCPDCLTELLNGNPDDIVEFFAFSNEEASLNIYNHLLEIGFETVQYYYNSNDAMYHIVCDESEADDARRQTSFFIEDGLEADMTPTQRVELSRIAGSVTEAENADDMSAAYISAKEKYANVNSSAISLLLVGGIGIVILLADITGIYRFPFNGSSRALFLSTMSIIFALFIIMGIVSLKNARKLAKDISKEAALQQKIEKYITDELDMSLCDADIEDNISPEEKYLIRMEYITSMTAKRFPDADSAFTEHIAESLYDRLFGE